MLVIQSRYQYWGPENKIIWTRWFNVGWDKYNNEEEAKDALKNIIEKTKPIDKLTKLKHEFQISEFNEV